MIISLVAIGRYRSGLETALTDDYIARAQLTGRGLGLQARLVEIVPRKDGQAAESAAILAALPAGAALAALDERGDNLSSAALARKFAAWRDGGRAEAMLAIGGADGHTEELRARADLVLSFGAQTWPHKLVRAMAAEQIYRAMTILAGHPYHREG